MSDYVTIEVIRGVEGPCLVVDDRRIAGPKPWGGGQVVYSFDIPKDKLLERLND